MTHPEAAALRLLELVRPLAAQPTPLSEAAGRVLAEPVDAPLSLPPFPRAALDGFALRAADAGKPGARLRISGTAAPGTRPAGGPAPGTAWRIATGAPLPHGADTVLPLEAARRSGSWLEVVRPAAGGANVSPPGEDIAAGARALGAGTRLGPAELGLLAALGFTSVPVVPAPRVGLLSTGSELRDPGRPLAPGTVYDANRFALAAELEAAGCAVSFLGIAGDGPASLAAAFRAACRAPFDALITTGGVSVGDTDRVTEAWLRLGAEFAVGRLALKPGAAFAAGTVRGRLLACLSGNPAACLTAFHLVVRPALLRLAGRRAVAKPWVPATLEQPGPRRSEAVRAVWCRLAGTEAPYRASWAAGQRPGTLAPLVGCNGLLALPPGTPALEAGAQAWALRLDHPETDELPRIPSDRPRWRPASRRRPLAVSVVGPSDAGKTRLVAGLVEAFAAMGLKVAAVKHAAHGFEVGERPGSDSARYPGPATGVVGPGGFYWREAAEPGLDAVMAWAAARELDLLLVEGYKAGPLPKVAVGPAPDGEVLAHVDEPNGDASRLAAEILERLRDGRPNA